MQLRWLWFMVATIMFANVSYSAVPINEIVLRDDYGLGLDRDHQDCAGLFYALSELPKSIITIIKRCYIQTIIAIHQRNNCSWDEAIRLWLLSYGMYNGGDGEGLWDVDDE